MSAFQKLSEPAWHALEEALRTYHWYKLGFENLVRGRFAEAPDALAAVNFDETKRTATGQLVRALRLNEKKYQTVVIDALVALSEVDPEFPHLARVEDRPMLVAEAKAAYDAVRTVIDEYAELAASRQAVRRAAEETIAEASARRQHDSQLHDQFLRMAQSSDQPQKRGFAFERFLNAMFELWDLYPRASYRIRHEQIDGAFTFHTNDYLLEAKWHAKPLGLEHLDKFKAKIDRKARNTLGLCISISGFSEGAIDTHSYNRTPLILMDGIDLMPILEGHIELTEVLDRKRRHAAETGKPMYRA